MDNVMDLTWVKSSFMLPGDMAIRGNETMINRIYSTSMQKASDTTLGGNFIINPLPQFTRYADLKHNVFAGDGSSRIINKVSRNNTTNPHGSNGMGRIYSEKIDDNKQVIHFRCGVPEFNSMTSFYSNYYSVPAASLARTGKSPGFFYELGWAMGTVATIPIMPIMFVAKTAKFFFRKPASKYYYLKPTMYPYWAAVTSMVNAVAANEGIIPRPFYEGTKALHDKDDLISESDITRYHELIPTIYRKNGGLDVFAISQRGQQLVEARHQLLNDKLRKVTNRDQMREVFKTVLYGGDIANARVQIKGYGETSLKRYREIWKQNQMMGGMTVEQAAANSDASNKAERLTGDITEGKGGFWQALVSEAQMGSQFISFRTEFTGTQSESFSNSVKEPTIKSSINNIAATARDTRFSMFDLNVDGAGVIGGAAESFKSFITGGAQAIGFQGLAQLAGSAFADIPKVWDSSSAEFNKMSISIPLRSPYGDPISRLQNIILPLCCLFAMSVPLATGKQSHTSPFLIEYFCQGRAHSRLAIVDSFSVTRGVGDVGWSNNGKFLAADVQMSLLDLSSSVAMHLNPEFSLSDRVIQAAGYGAGAAAGWMTDATNVTESAKLGVAMASALLGSTYDDDNNYTDYLALLAGLPLEAEINTLRKWSVRLAQQQANFDNTFSQSRAAAWAMSGTFGDIAMAFSRAPDRQ